jgi:hypothetical protein
MYFCMLFNIVKYSKCNRAYYVLQIQKGGMILQSLEKLDNNMTHFVKGINVFLYVI